MNSIQSISQKLVFLDLYVLEPFRRFHIIPKDQINGERTLLTWTRGPEECLWHFNGHFSNGVISTKNLLTLLQNKLIDLQDFEKQLTAYLKSYGAHLLVSYEKLQYIVPLKSIEDSQRAMAAFCHNVFDTLEQFSSVTDR